MEPKLSSSKEIPLSKLAKENGKKQIQSKIVVRKSLELTREELP